MSLTRNPILSPWLALLLLSVLVRIAYGKFLLLDHWPGDASWYMEAAQALVEKGRADPYWPPGLPHLLAGGLVLGIGHHWLGMVISLGMWMLFFYVLRTVVFSRGNSSKGWWLKAIFLTYPAFIHQSVVPLTYLPVAILLLMSWQWMAGSWGGNPWKEGTGLGIVLGLMVLFRAASMVMLPVILLGYAWNRGQWKSMILPGLIAMTMIGLWESKVYQQEERWVMVNTANSYNFYLGNNDWTPDYKTWLLGSQDFHDHPDYTAFYAEIDSVRGLPDHRQEAAFRQLGWDHIQAHPVEFCLRAGSRLATLLSFDTLAGATMYRQSKGWGILLLAMDAICYIALLLMAWYGWSGKRWRSRERFLWLALGAAYILPYLMAFAHPTYHLPLLGLFAWSAFRGDAFSWAHLKQRSVWSWGILAVLMSFQVLWLVNMVGEL